MLPVMPAIKHKQKDGLIFGSIFKLKKEGDTDESYYYKKLYGGQKLQQTLSGGIRV